MKVSKSMRIDQKVAETFDAIKSQLQQVNYGVTLSDAKVLEYLIAYYADKELKKEL